MSRRSNRSLLPKDLMPGEKALLEEWGDVIAEAHPNPERKGCPDRETLLVLATDTKAFGRRADSKDVLRHLGTCSPCGHDLKELRYQAIQKQKFRTIAWAIGCLVLMSLAGIVVWRVILHK